MRWDLQDPQLLPAITLHNEQDGNALCWYPRRDLLNSTPLEPAFVAEMSADGTTSLRFGDGQQGLRPAPGSSFYARYRVGNGVAGNMGAEGIAHIVSNQRNIVGISNPLPAMGGLDPESIEEVRQQAPAKLQVQQRAVTPGDYVEIAQRHPEVRQATTTIRWIGGIPTVFLAVERSARRPVDADFQSNLFGYMQPFRLAGYDLVIKGPVYVSLEIEMTVTIKPGYFRNDVKSALLNIFSNRVLPNGRPGLFHPDNFTFGQTVYISPLYAAALAVQGVDCVEFTTFQRQNRPDPQALRDGMLNLARVEIARIDNDPYFPDHGILRINLEHNR